MSAAATGEARTASVVRAPRDGGPWGIFRSADEAPRPWISAWNAYARYWSKYAVFTGRASRSEFWWVWLGNTILYAFIAVGTPLVFGLQPSYTVSTGFLGPVLSPFGAFMNGSGSGAGSPFDDGVVATVLVLAFSIVTFVPTIALAFRRLQDIGIPGCVALLGLAAPWPSGALLLVALVPSRAAGARYDRPIVRLAATERSPRPLIVGVTSALVAAVVVGVLVVALAPGAVPSRVQGSWHLVSSTGTNGRSTTLPARPVSLTLTGKSLSGNDSCNDYTGQVAGTDPWRTRELEWTLIACGDGDDHARNVFRHDLETLSSARLRGSDLVLTCSDGTTLRFEPCGPSRC